MLLLERRLRQVLGRRKKTVYQLFHCFSRQPMKIIPPQLWGRRLQSGKAT